jgi:hypothetical protein
MPERSPLCANWRRFWDKHFRILCHTFVRLRPHRPTEISLLERFVAFGDGFMGFRHSYILLAQRLRRDRTVA